MGVDGDQWQCSLWKSRRLFCGVGTYQSSNPLLACSSCAGVPLPALPPSLHCNTTYALLSCHLFIHPSIYNQPLILHSGSHGLLEPFPSVMGIVSIQPTTPVVYFKLLIMSICVVAFKVLIEQHFSIQTRSLYFFLLIAGFHLYPTKKLTCYLHENHAGVDLSLPYHCIGLDFGEEKPTKAWQRLPCVTVPFDVKIFQTSSLIASICPLKRFVQYREMGMVPQGARDL